MAEKILNTRILLKTDTLENWNNSTLGLKKGELAIATVAATEENGLTEPVTMIKIGEDGEKTFKDLPWALYANAADVLAACKSEAGLKAFVNGVIADAGIASDEAMQELAGKVTTAEGKITTLEGEMDAVEKVAGDNAAAIKALQELVGDDKVADQISAAIAAQELDKKYDAIGSAAAVQSDLDTYKTSNDAAVAANTAAIEAEAATARAAEKKNEDAIKAIKDGTTIDSFADVETALAGKEAAGEAAKAEAAAKLYADGLASNYDAKGSAATAEQNAKDYADGLAGNYDAKGSAATAEQNANDYTDGRISAMVGDKSVQAQIEDLKLSETYDAKGAAATAESNAKTHANNLNTAMDERMQVVEGKAHEHTFVESELNKIADGDVAKWNAAEQNAKDYADGLDEVMAERVKTLEDKFTGDDSVADQIATAVAAEAELREAADSDLQDAIDALAEDTIEQIEAAVKAEKERAEGIEGGLEERLAAVEEDYLTAADKKALQDQIDLIIDNPDTEKVINSISEFTQYIADHGEIAEGFRTDIDANADDIDALEGRMDTAEGEIDALQEAVATKAAQADLETLAGRVTTAEGKVTTLEGEMDAVEGRATALEELVGDTKVETQIEAAIEALKIGDYAKAADLTAAINQHNTDKAALEASIATKANDADLAAIAKSGNVNDLIQTAGDVLIFDCGTSV